MTARRQKAAEQPSAPPERRCAECGRPCPPPTLEAISARLRELVEATPHRPFPEGPLTDAERASAMEGRAEYYSSATITLRVSIHMLAAQIDGVCVYCARGPD